MSDFNHYPNGKDLLWMAHFVDAKGNDIGSMKYSGTLVEAAEQAEKYAQEWGQYLQCLRRRYP